MVVTIYCFLPGPLSSNTDYDSTVSSSYLARLTLAIYHRHVKAYGNRVFNAIDASKTTAGSQSGWNRAAN